MVLLSLLGLLLMGGGAWLLYYVSLYPKLRNKIVSKGSFFQLCVRLWRVPQRGQGRGRYCPLLQWDEDEDEDDLLPSAPPLRDLEALLALRQQQQQQQQDLMILEDGGGGGGSAAQPQQQQQLRRSQREMRRRPALLDDFWTN